MRNPLTPLAPRPLFYRRAVNALRQRDRGVVARLEYRVRRVLAHRL